MTDPIPPNLTDDEHREWEIGGETRLRYLRTASYLRTNISEADKALRALVLRAGITITTSPGAPLWLRIGDIADAIEARLAAVERERDAARMRAIEHAAAASTARSDRQHEIDNLASENARLRITVGADGMLREHALADAEVRAERAEAACAEMRAALDRVARECLPVVAWSHEARQAAEAAQSALSRTDLGRGWASPEVVARCRTFVASVPGDFLGDALLADAAKKGGG